MNNLNVPYDIQKNIFNLIENKISVQVFENWLYNAKNLEYLLGEVYFELIILDFKDYHIQEEVRKVSEKILDYSKHEKVLLTELLQNILRIDENLPKYLELVYNNCHHHLLEELGLQTYGLTFEYGTDMKPGIYHDENWKNYSDDERKEIVMSHYTSIKNEINEILSKIEEFNFTGDFARNKSFIIDE